MHPAQIFFLVASGGACGAAARYALALIGQRWSPVLPLGTLAANLLGCFAIAVLLVLAEEQQWVSERAMLFFASGFCGAFTTFSSFVMEINRLLKAGATAQAAGYFTLTFAGVFLSFYAGVVLTRALLRS